MSLLGRAGECALLDGLVVDVCRGESRSLVLRGEAGVGKTALLDYLVESASDLTVGRAVGVESEMELAFAGLHQLCAPMLDRLERLPGAAAEALEIAFGLAPARPRIGSSSASPSWPVVEVADDRPLVCLVDDAQWLDRASAQVLGFVARRLLAESVGIVFAVRDPAARTCRTSPSWRSGGCGMATLARCWPRHPGRLDERVRDRIVAETRGNPLALLELPRELTAAELAGGFGFPAAMHVRRTHRGQLPAAPRRRCPRREPAAAGGSGRAARGRGPGLARGRTARHRRRRARARGRRRAADDRRPGAVPPSAGALGGLSIGDDARTGERSTTRWRR